MIGASGGPGDVVLAPTPKATPAFAMPRGCRAPKRLGAAQLPANSPKKLRPSGRSREETAWSSSKDSIRFRGDVAPLRRDRRGLSASTDAYVLVDEAHFLRHLMAIVDWDVPKNRACSAPATLRLPKHPL